MNASRHLTSVASAVILCLSSALTARATSSHTWVSGIGNDANAGTAAAPFATFATAITNTSAGGMITVADSGDFGPISILQSVTIEGMPGATITFTSAEGIYIAVNVGQTVIIRNLAIDGLGVGTDGIFFAANAGSGAPATCIVDNCRIANCSQIGIGTGDAGPTTLVVRNTSIDGGTLGVRTFQGPGPTHVHLYNVHISNATSAAVFSRSGTVDMRQCEITDSAIGIENDTNAIISADSCVFSQDAVAVICYSGSIDRLSNNDLWDCTTGISAGGGGTYYSDGTNRKGGLVSGSMPPNATMPRY
jgi:hypothetical protein